ncbi:MAG: sigma-70 family RNA polymerase sigma factor [Actinobacteria bacterium]|nr:sigma-70 family RNA polymerase sigma factor [Actinomycetota bacterium]
MRGYLPKKFQCHGGVHMDLQEMQLVRTACHRAVVVAALQQHSALGLQMLYADCEHDVRNVVLRRLGVQAASDDVVHETFLRASDRIDQLLNSQKLESWLCAIAKNESYKYLRQYQRMSVGIVDFDLSDAEEVSAIGEWHDLVERASKGLGARDQHFLEMLVGEDLGWQEIAEQLHISLINVYKFHHRVEERLAQSCVALELAISHRFQCEELCELLSAWTGEYSPLWRKRIVYHAQQCAACSGAIKKTPAFRLGSF